MSLFLILFGVAALLPVVAARVFFLGRWRVGWVMYLANVVWELAEKRLKVSRMVVEAGAALLGLTLLLIGGVGGGIVSTLAVVIVALELSNRLWERELLAASYTTPDPCRLPPAVDPQLTLNLRAPFVARSPRYQLGSLLVGRPLRVELLLGNHTRIPTMAAVRAEISTPAGWLAEGSAQQSVGVIAPGEVASISWELTPPQVLPAGSLDLVVTWGGMTQAFKIAFDGCVPAEDLALETAAISRYPGACQSAFAWRGDMDLYDTATCQSIEGLEEALKLAARHCFPQTMCLSTRLSLDEAAAREWSERYSLERPASEIPDFIAWLRESVELTHRAPYPTHTNKPYSMELGNHGHLHYGTDTSAAPGNGWLPQARMGAGAYAWVGDDKSSFGEQRDNVLEAARWCREQLDFVPRTWAKPGRCNDGETARAMEAAGCDVLSGSDIRARDNVLFQPPPHHPGDTSAVELTSRYPCDPQHIYHVAMLHFWLHRSLRLGVPMIYMCHQHMRQFDGLACTRFTEHMLRHVLIDYHGDFYIDTLYGVGAYWREVLSPKSRRVVVAVEGASITVTNGSELDLAKLPVDLKYRGGLRRTVLVDVPAGAAVRIDGAGALSKSGGAVGRWVGCR
ncbi:MAG: hypothetical protein HN700_13875 [Verrucomicrobia bacterium]|jgi:hypothetical protein|nr:hypothetical protein [Verrucomicrobiota bacterium]